MFGDRERAMKAMEIPEGASIYLGAPATPMPKAHSDAITQMVSNIPEIEEAHLPQCYLAGVVDPPAQILVVVVRPVADTQAVIQALGRSVFDTLPKGTHLDIYPAERSDPVLSDVRECGCEILRRTTVSKSWWKFW